MCSGADGVLSVSSSPCIVILRMQSNIRCVLSPHPTLFNGANFRSKCVLHFLRWLPSVCVIVCLHTLTLYCCCLRMHAKNLTKQHIFCCCCISISIFLLHFMSNFCCFRRSLYLSLILVLFVLLFSIAYVIVDFGSKSSNNGKTCLTANIWEQEVGPRDCYLNLGFGWNCRSVGKGSECRSVALLGG